MHAYILIIGTHFSCGRGPAGPRFVLGSSVLRYTQSVSYVLATKIATTNDKNNHSNHETNIQYNHNDNKRKDNYYKRHGKAKFETAKYFSHKYLW